MTERHAIAKVTGELEGVRGPDVRTKIAVPREWLERGGTFAVTRPRLVTCEQCGGGGCASCGYQGAFKLLANPPHVAEIQLPANEAPEVVVVRLPHQGVKREDNELAGHWLIEVHMGALSAGVNRAGADEVSPDWRLKLAAMVLVLLGLWVLLRLWG